MVDRDIREQVSCRLPSPAARAVTAWLWADPRKPVVDDQGLVSNSIAPHLAPVLLRDSNPISTSALQPDKVYVSPGFEYLTDDQGRPARVRGLLRIVPKHEHVRHPSVQSTTAPGPGMHGGHIVAVSLGGFASGPNLFPQDANFNVSAYSRLEHGWRRALRSGLSVAVDIALTDEDGDTPGFLIVTHWENSQVWETVLLNEPRAQ